MTTRIGSIGNDTIVGTFADDHLEGNTGNDTLYGGAGDDYLQGNRGNDTVAGGAGNDYVRGGKDDDYLSGSDGNDQAKGDLGNDDVYGGSGNDLLRGGQDNDYLNGGAGDDLLLGDKGFDQIQTGDGADIVRLAQGEEGNRYNQTEVFDFSALDRIELVVGNAAEAAETVRETGGILDNWTMSKGGEHACEVISSSEAGMDIAVTLDAIIDGWTGDYVIDVFGTDHLNVSADGGTLIFTI